MWLYLHRVFMGWAGILLGVDGGVALLERYLGETVEKFLRWRWHIPTKYKLWFAAAVLVVAQGRVYFDMQENLAQAGRDNDGLHAAITTLQNQVNDLKTKPAQSPSRADTTQIENIRNSLGSFIDEGVRLRDRVPLGADSVPPDLQPEVQKWRARVFQYLKENLDAADAATFSSYQVKGYPENYNLMQQIGALEELLKEPKLRP